MYDNLTSFLDPIAKIWDNQQVLSQIVSSPKAKLANKINKKKTKKKISKKGYQAGTFFTYI